MRARGKFVNFVDLAESASPPVRTLLIWYPPRLEWQGWIGEGSKESERRSERNDGRTVRIEIYQDLDIDPNAAPQMLLRTPAIFPGASGMVRCDSLSAAIAEVPLLMLEKGLIPWRSVFSSHWELDPWPRQWYRFPTPYPGQEWPEAIELGGCLWCEATGSCPRCSGTSLHIEGRAHINCLCFGDGMCPICQGTRLQPVINTQFRNEHNMELVLVPALPLPLPEWFGK